MFAFVTTTYNGVKKRNEIKCCVIVRECVCERERVCERRERERKRQQR